MLTVVYTIILLWLLWELYRLNPLKRKVPLEKIYCAYNGFFNGDYQTKLPCYKFYRSLIENLMKAHHQYGVKIKQPLRELKEAFRKDFSHEKSIIRSERESWLQFFAVALITWTMIFCTKTIVQIHFTLFQLFCLASWQLIGLGVFSVFKKRFKTGSFKDFLLILKRLIQWRSQLGTGLALSSIFKEFKFDWNQEFSKELRPLVRRLEQSVGMTLKSGQPIQEELSDIINELWQHYQDLAIGYQRYQLKLRFLCLIGFFVPTYFVFVFFMLQSFTNHL